jgi:hypothetical protein
MNYGDILNRSWRIVWNYKFMILLGFLAALGSGMGSGNVNYTADSSDFQNFPMTDWPGNMPDPAQVMAVIGALAVGVACFAFIVGIALWILRLTAEAGLIDAASRLDAGQKVTLGEAMRAGWGKIWSMIGLSLLMFGVVLAIIIVVMLIFGLSIGGTIAGGIAAGEDMAGAFAALGAGLVALLCCVICGIALLAIVLSIIYIFAQRAIVLENEGVLDGIRRGWEVIRSNVGEVIILLILFMFLGFVVSAIVALVSIPLAALSFGPGAWRLFSGESLGPLEIILMVVGGLAWIVVVAAIRSFFTAFSSSAYTLAYQEFTDKQLPPPDFVPEKLPPAE